MIQRILKHSTQFKKNEQAEITPQTSERDQGQPTWITNGHEHADEYEDTAAGAVMMVKNESKPKTVQKALSETKNNYWTSTMDKEINSPHENNTWKLVPRESEMHVLQPIWVLKVIPETKNQEIIVNARLVCKGYLQK